MLNSIKNLETLSIHLPKPENYFSGVALPQGAALPDNILCFYHDWIYPGAVSHARWMLVIPFRPMKYQIDNTEILLDENCALLIRPHETRSLQGSGKHYGRLFISFELSSEQTYLPSRLSELHEAEYPMLEEIMTHFREKNSWECSWALWKLLEKLNRQPLEGVSRSISPVIARTVRFINNNLNRMFSLQEIADSIHSSESNLRLIFRKEMKVSLGQYIAGQRIAAAKHRLAFTQQSIAEIAEGCGYESIYVFSRFFRKQTGLPPSRYRNRILRKTGLPLSE